MLRIRLTLLLFVCFTFAASQVVNDRVAVDDAPLRDYASQMGISVEHLERVREVISAQTEHAVAYDGEPTTNVIPFQDKVKDISQDHIGNKHGKPSIVELNSDVLPYLFQGDILLNEQQLDMLERELEGSAKSSRARRFAPITFAKRWDKTKPIPYRFEDTLPEFGRQAVKNAIEILSSRSCLTFQLMPSSSYGLSFLSAKGCNSYIGQQQSWQPVSLGTGCHSTSTATHEILHALGSDHEQDRADRNNYVKVDLSLVHKNYTNNFELRTPQQNDNLGVPYDFGSIMQYGAYDFSMVPGKPVIVPHDILYLQTLGQSRFVAFNDLKGLNKLYKCNDNCPSPPQCQNGGYVHPKDCSKCVCNDFYRGSSCETPIAIREIAADRRLNISHSSIYRPDNLTPYVEWTKFEKLSATIFSAPVGKRLNVTINALSSFYQCNQGCPFAGIEVVEGDDLTRGGKTFCCGKTDVGTSFTTITNIIGLKEWNFPGDRFNVSLTISAV